jgi:hypothetical protein
MKTRGALLKGSLLAAAAAIAGGALWVRETPAQVDATSSALTVDTSTALAVPATQIQRPWSNRFVVVSGVVSGTPESVSFTGVARVGARLAPDPDFGFPSLVMTIDLTGITGVGLSTRTKYAIGGPEIVQRRLAATHLVDITFPFYQSGTDGSSGARSGAASFALDVDTASGSVTSATGSIASSPL